MKIGIIGFGYVGNAVCSSYEGKADCFINDESKGYHASYQELKQCDAIFICVPSPQLPNGECDSSILQSVVNKLKDYSGVIISKVTAPPDVYSQFSGLFYVPEFLTARNSVEDYKATKTLIIGGNKDHHLAERIIKVGLPNLQHIRYVTLQEASVIKYTTNAFLATKVVFMNEVKDLCDKTGIDYDVVKASLSLDSRIGSTHLDVPGHDGSLGYGGMCFPKDMSALSTFSGKSGGDLSLVNQAIAKNKAIRIE